MKQQNNHEFARRLRQAREDRGWTQEKLASQIRVSPITVSRWERGVVFPTPYYRERLTSLFATLLQHLDHATPPDNTLIPSEQEIVPSAIMHLPHRPTPMIGRNNELIWLQERLSMTQSTIALAVYGMPGVGKTSLTIEIGYNTNVRALFPDGILWAGIGPEPKIPALLAEWGVLLGQPLQEAGDPASVESLQRLIQASLANRRMLLILDDVWSIEAAYSMNIGGSQCACILTTRSQPLAFQFAHNHLLELHELPESLALDLLHQLAPEATEYNASDARKLVRSVGGLPLPLTLMGHFLQMQSLTHQPRRIHDALMLLRDTQERLALEEPSRTGPRSLKAAIALSVNMLMPHTQQVFHQLSIFPPKPSSFSEAAAVAATGEAIEILGAIIDELTDSGLLESCAPGRYNFHQTITDYAHASVYPQESVKRIVQFFNHLITTHRLTYDTIDIELSNIVALLETAFVQQYDTLLIQFCLTFAPYALTRGLYDLLEQQTARAFAAAYRLEIIPDCLMLLALRSQNAMNRGDNTAAEQMAHQGLIMASETGNNQQNSVFLAILSIISTNRGQVSEVESDLRQALVLARERQDLSQWCMTLLILAYLVWLRGDSALAQEYGEEGLTVARRLGDVEMICPLLLVLSGLLGSQGAYDASRSYAEEGSLLARSLGHQDYLSAHLALLGVNALHCGDLAQAEMHLQEALKIARQINHAERLCLILANLGETLLQAGQHEDAESYLREGLDLVQRNELPERESNIRYVLGMLSHVLGQNDEAEDHLNKSVAIARAIERPYTLAASLQMQGNFLLDVLRWHEAKQAFAEALAIGRRTNSKDLMGPALFGLARVATLQKQIELAYVLGMESLQMSESTGHALRDTIQDWITELPIKIKY